MKRAKILLKFGILLLLLINPQYTTANVSVSISFLDTDGHERSITEFTDKPILLEWGATWCTICERNQEEINEMFDQYKDDINFISLSFGTSGDTVKDVKEMKLDRGYNWTFGLDHTNYALDYNVFNGYTWIISQDLELVKTCNSTIVTSQQLADAFEDIFDIENQLTESDELIVGPSDSMIIIGMSLLVLVARRNGKQSL